MVDMPIVYVLKSLSVEKTYVGSTDNFERRLHEHNTGKSSFTKTFRPWKLVYKEECETLSAARKREKYYKSAAGRKILKKLLTA